MGNPDLCIVFNDGMYAVVVGGNQYDTRGMALTYAIGKWNEYKNEVYKWSGSPEEICLQINSINIHEIADV